MIGHLIGEGMRQAAYAQRRQAYAPREQDDVRELRERAEQIRRERALRTPLAGNPAVEGALASPAPGSPSGAALAVRAGAPVMRAQRDRIDGAETLEYARRFLAHFAVWPSEAALTACALWAGHAWARDASRTLVWLSTPRLLFSSAEPGSGKSHAMTLVSRLCPDPEVMVEPSEPAVAHSIGEHRTLAIDELDVLFGAGQRKAAIRAVVNMGYTVDGTWDRVRNGSVHRISTFGPMLLAGLDKVDTGTSGTMAATLSRCIRVKMRKAPEDWRAPRFGRQARFAASVIGERLGMWCAQELPALAAHVPDTDLGLREAQLWEPLLTVADIAGGDWPALARDAADELITTGGMAAEQEDERLDRLEDIMAGWGEE